MAVNGAVVEYTGAEQLAIDALGGVDAASFLSGPIGLPFTAAGLEPTVSAGGNETIPVGPFTRAGSFTDIRAGQTWTATVDFGDGSGAEPLTLNPDGTFTLTHTYAEPGEYLVTVLVTDGEGNLGLAEFLVVVTAVVRGGRPQVTPGADLISANAAPHPGRRGRTATAISVIRPKVAPFARIFANR